MTAWIVAGLALLVVVLVVLNIYRKPEPCEECRLGSSAPHPHKPVNS